MKITKNYKENSDATLFLGDCRKLIKQIPDEKAQLIITSPPYNLEKAYEKNIPIDHYLEEQTEIIKHLPRILSKKGSLCWQVGNYVDKGEIIPLDTLLYPIFKAHNLKLRNRIIWHFEHGLHCSRRLSGRYETILWFTKTNEYVFNLDPIRVPQKYPGKKYFKGPRKGQYSANPLGKNPGDLWIIPNVKHNHPEKTIHPCQFPIELIERLILSMTKKGDLVFDPFIGVGTTAISAFLNKRRAAGADTQPEYIEISKKRLKLAEQEKLPIRPRNRPIYNPPKNTKITTRPKEFDL